MRHERSGVVAMMLEKAIESCSSRDNGSDVLKACLRFRIRTRTSTVCMLHTDAIMSHAAVYAPCACTWTYTSLPEQYVQLVFVDMSICKPPPKQSYSSAFSMFLFRLVIMDSARLESHAGNG